MPNSYAGKRILDIIGAIIGIILLAPIFPFIAIAIKLDSKGKVIEQLPRISNGNMVRVYKFRSMIDGAHAMRAKLASFNERNDGPYFKIRNDPRITRIGRILRMTRIDEFPQLINVLKGELALVGPRPHLPEEVTSYPERFKYISLSKAGVTGLSQVSGASSLPFLKELELDSYYLKHQSLLFDLKIILKTIEILFTDPTAV